MTSVDHFLKKSGSVGRERALYLEAGKGEVLDRTIKTDEILSGPFGTVNAVRTCFYTRPIENGPGSVAVIFNSNQTAHEVPSKVSNPIQALHELSSFSLIRVFRTSPEYVIISANYERDGSLGSLDFGAAKHGLPSRDGPFGTQMFRPDNPLINELQRKQLGPSLAKYGIPDKIDIQKYLVSHRTSLPDVAFDEERSVMNVFYGFGKLIRQDELKDGTVVASRWLQPSVTEEEKTTLNPLCDARFHQQQAIGLPTVE